MKQFGSNQMVKLQNATVIRFTGKRRVLSTGPLGGGISEHLTAAFNLDMKEKDTKECRLRAATYPEHMALAAEELGFKAEYTTGLGTAASMKHTAIKVKAYRELIVSAMVTAGVDVNGGRAGDPASWYETEDGYNDVSPGTVNIFLDINAGLSDSAILQSLMVCTEAKAAALQELLAPSLYSSGIATGSGTDGVVIITEPESNLVFSDAGKHSKLGELIGLAVLEAVKEALFLETGLCPAHQHTVLRRLERFGVTEDSLWESYRCGDAKNRMPRELFDRILQTIDGEESCVLYTSLYVHLADQLDWGMIGRREALQTADELLDKMDMGLPHKREKKTGNGREELMEHYVTGITGKITRIWEERK
ncbi:adenosylcobinamide amidohydrolase [Ruminococcus sp. OA3]|uniref:adenosylcobinamide amidohydrolase n=1 Tax=Ruminococcus sp. OA3 TaxID=2914164 RepID=UPI001F05822F|nr:adenosylcobinamide amidohydrolase [Ruminococcus sp. OA3]MCH1982299.1 adenosylcobinamide amidohydrolase [Ruminococcus sp. OA3]